MQVVKKGEAFVLTDGTNTLSLTPSKYEDLFYAIPVDNGTLYRLINDTILEDTATRTVYKAMIDKAGGIDPFLNDLQKQVQTVQPG